MKPAGAVLALIACACSQADYDLLVRFEPASAASTAERIEVALVASCAAHGAPIGEPVAPMRTIELRRGALDASLGAITPGTYGLVGRAFAPSCAIVAAGCEDVTLAAGGSGNLVLVLDAMAGPGCDADETCVGGACISTMDGGTDSVVPDAPLDGSIDAGPPPSSLCEMNGYFVSSTIGNDVTDMGTTVAPFRTIAFAIAEAVRTGRTAVCVGEGTYTEKVTLRDGVSLYGGFACTDVDCSWQLDPGVVASVVQNIDAEGMLADETVTRATRVEGLVIQGMNTTIGAGESGAGVSLNRGTPMLDGNQIRAGEVTCSSGFCTGAAIVLRGPSNDWMGALVANNRIEAGTGTHATYAVLLAGAPGGVIAIIEGNEIYGGSSRYSRAVATILAADGTIIRRNTISAGSEAPGVRGTSFALSVMGGDVVIDGNWINTDPATTGTCTMSGSWCGGIEINGATATITNNVVFGVPAPESAALYLSNAESEFGDVIVNGNTLSGGRDGTSVVTAAIACRALGTTLAGIVGRIRNNILLGGNGESRFGMYEDDQTSGHTCEPGVFSNNAIHVEAGALYRRWSASGAPSTLSTIADVDALSFAMDDIAADPLLDASHHLGAGSPCIDRGTNVEAPSLDFEGDGRPRGMAVDIGADERE